MPKIEFCFGIKTFLNTLKNQGLLSSKEVQVLLQSFSKCGSGIKDLKEKDIKRLLGEFLVLHDLDYDGQNRFIWQARMNINDVRLENSCKLIEVLCARMGIDAKVELVQALIIKNISLLPD